MKAKSIFFSFDYELFLGKRSGTIFNCMVKPTEEIVKILDTYNFKGIFFVDFTYLSVLEKNGNATTTHDFHVIINQLRELVQKGHFIFPHLHPHWIDAKYIENENQWDLSDLQHYTLHSLEDAEINRLFEESFKYMYQIYDDKLPEMIGYRAGGLFIQPFQRVQQQFLKHSISFDSSVVANSKKVFEFGSFDYSTIQSESPYFFSDEVTHQQKNGLFIEMPITSLQLNFRDKLLNSLYFRLKQKKQIPFGDGISTRFNSANNIKRKNWVTYFMENNVETCSIELFNPIKKNRIQKLLKKQDYVMILSHPKLISAQQLSYLDSFIQKMNKKYTINTNPITYIYNLKQKV